MALAPQEFLSARFEAFNRLSTPQKLGLMLGLAFIVSLAVGAWLWSQTPNYKVLYSNLGEKDGGAVIAALQQGNIPYKVAEGGTAITVPADQVYEVRLRLASQGIPRGGNVGFELLDNQQLGTTQFQEQVNYQRALEGELARTIESLASVQQVRVHLAIPRPSVFIREQEKPSASVLLTLYPGRSLDATQIAGIVNLVASSVPELTPKNVTIVNQAGDLLTRPADDMAAGLEPAQLDYLRKLEHSYIKRIESILTPITGQNNLQAQVAAEVDFSQQEQTAETFKPNPKPEDASVRSEQTTENRGGGPQASGIPGALSNEPPGAASAPITAPTVTPAAGGASSESGTTYRESTINYELDKTIRHVKQPAGAVKRLSVAVVVNNRTVKDKDGKEEVKPYTEDEMKQITSLVKEAMGYNQERGDTLNVVNAAFNVAGTPEVPLWKDPVVMDWAKDIIKYVLFALMALLFMLLVIRPLIKVVSPPEAEAEGEEGGEEGLEAGAGAGAGGGLPGEPGAEEGVSYEADLHVVRELAKQDPRMVANIIREWVNSE